MLITSPVFVFIFLSSPIWLGFIAYLTKGNAKVSRLFMSYAALFLVLVLIVFSSYDQSSTWLSFFTFPGFMVFPCSVIASVITYKNDSDISGSLEYLFFFGCITILSYFVISITPGVIEWIIGFFSGLFEALVEMFQNIINTPSP